MSEPRFKVGDNVKLAREFTYDGYDGSMEPLSTVPIGTYGTVIEPGWEYLSEGGIAADVAWNIAAEDAQFAVDEVCLELAAPLPDLTDVDALDRWLRDG